MSSRFTRARKPEQKEERRVHLLGTARALLDGGVDLGALSLNELARRAGMAKANIYRYFESRESLLLALLGDERLRWFQGFSSELSRDRRAIELDALVALLARSVAREPLLCALMAALPSVLERNLSEETIRTLKRDYLEFLGEVAALLEARCRALPASSYAELLHDTTIAIVGLYPSTYPAPAVARVVNTTSEFRFFRRDFADELERFLRALAADRAARCARSAVARRARGAS